MIREPRHRYPLRAAVVLVVVALALTGCSPMGPRSISVNRAAYNMAIQQTNDQELLLNLVRMRYRDTLYFTYVERIAASLQFNRSMGVSATAANTDNAFAVATPSGAPISDISLRSLSLGPLGVSLNENPTIFYAPIEGEKFVRQMMTPMNPELLFLLVKAGWPIDRVFAVAVQEVNGLRNFSGGALRAGRLSSSLADFREAIGLLHDLAMDNLIDLGRSDEKGGGVEVRFIGESSRTPEALRLKSLLGLARDRDRYRIIAGGEVHDPDTISVLPRPMLAAMNYLAQGVEAPEVHIAGRRVSQFRGKPGSGNAQADITGSLFRIRVSNEPPADASVSIFYRDHFYYLPDDDLESKATFLLLTQLIALHASPSTAAPGVSLSIGR
jgi:hypothetical protein